MWAYFVELSRARSNNGFGPNCLSYSDILAWQNLTGNRLDRWELSVMLKLDQAYLTNYATHNQPKGTQ